MEVIDNEMENGSMSEKTVIEEPLVNKGSQSDATVNGNSAFSNRSEGHESSPNTDLSTVQKNGGMPLWADMLAIVGVLIGSSFIGLFVKMIVEKTANATPEFGTFVAYLLQFGITIGFALWQRKKRGDQGPLLRFSLKRANPTLVLWGVILLMLISVVLEPLLSLFPQTYLDMLKDTAGSGGWAVLTLVIVAPIVEEVLFRGIVQETVTRQYGAWRGLLVASAIFGIIHFIPQQVINAFFAGLVLGYIYLKTGSLIPVIMIHAINNAIAYIGMAMFDEQGVFYLHDVIANPFWYWLVYAICVVIFIIAAVCVVLQIRKINAENSPTTK